MSFTRDLLLWYRDNQRDLPWRRTKDPYCIWISEIIFQQTRISQGTGYYTRFISVFPDIRTLADATEENVLKLWQGLGYYSRARNLHEAAKEILKNYDGNFPETYAKILTLKGIGNYTAAAIASIAFGIPEPVVDGNVLRFYARYFGIQLPVDSAEGKKAVYKKAMKYLDPKDPGTFNQAVMEFGALQCKPGKPFCEACPLKKNCYAYKTQKVDLLPVKQKKILIRDRYFYYLVLNITIRNECLVYLNRRIGQDIWKNLYDFPAIESPVKLSEEEILSAIKTFLSIQKLHITGIKPECIHLLTHQRIHATFYYLDLSAKVKLPYELVSLDRLSKYPVPKVIEPVFSYLCAPKKEQKHQMDDGPAKYQTLNNPAPERTTDLP